MPTAIEIEIMKCEGEIVGCEWWEQRDASALFALQGAIRANMARMAELKEKVFKLKAVKLLNERDADKGLL